MTCKKYVRRVLNARFDDALKDALKDVMPWAVAGFVVILLLRLAFSSLTKNNRPKLELTVFLGVVILYLNLLALGRGTPVFYQLNLSLVYLLLLLAMVFAVRKSWRKVTSFFTRLLKLFQAKSQFSSIVVIYLILLPSTVFLAQGLYLQHSHTLHHNGKWTNTKASMAKGVSCAVSYLTTQPALHRDRLNLGHWHGFHEVLLKEKISFNRVEFDFLLTPNSYFSFIYDKDGTGFSGIRISNHPKFESIRFRSSPEGEFLEKTSLTVPPLKEDWNGFVFSKNETGCSALLNQQLILDKGQSLKGPQILGFRGCHLPAYMDNVKISLGEETVLEEDFSNKRNWGLALGLSVLGFLLFHGLGCFLLGRLKARLHARPIFYLLGINLLLLAIGGAYLFLDIYYLSNKPPMKVKFYDYKNTIENEQQVRDRLKARLSREKEGAFNRIMFLGSSQMWGSGALKEEDLISNRLEMLLNATIDSITPFQCVNMSVSGSRSNRLLELYKSEWIKWRPQLLVIDLSHNDVDSDLFENSLKEFIAYNNKKGIKTLFVLEPASIELDKPSLFKNHDIMRKLGEAHNIPVVDMHAKLLIRFDTGFLWWDYIHLSSYGQRLFAEELLSPVLKVFNP